MRRSRRGGLKPFDGAEIISLDAMKWKQRSGSRCGCRSLMGQKIEAWILPNLGKSNLGILMSVELDAAKPAKKFDGAEIISLDRGGSNEAGVEV